MKLQLKSLNNSFTSLWMFKTHAEQGIWYKNILIFIGSSMIYIFIIIDVNFSLIYLFVLYNLLNVKTYLLYLCLLVVMMNHTLDIFSVISWKHCSKWFFSETESDCSLLRTFWCSTNAYVNRVLHYNNSLLQHSPIFPLVFK